MPSPPERSGLEHEALENAAQRTGTGPFLDRLGSEFRKRVFREFEINPIEREQFGKLLCERVAGFGQNLAKLVFGEFFQNGHHGQATDELRNKPISQEVFGFDLL